ncbi:hypothetical protein, partial [Microbacterium sp. A94]|uniref:hypothetical protein n=1 Tax=Microbacterium sp. A94 TaxID=3450717 RepID=UPI003F43E6AA
DEASTASPASEPRPTKTLTRLPKTVHFSNAENVQSSSAVDKLQDAAVKVSDLPELFNVSARTIRDWIAKDNIATFPYPIQNDTGARALAVRWGDIHPACENQTRWTRR